MSLLTYHQRKAQGRCPDCGGERDQPPYSACSQCYTPHPETRAHLFPGIPSNTLEYRQRYHRLQQGGAFSPANQMACCGAWHVIGPLPWRLPCCGRVIPVPRGPEETPHA